MSTISRAKLICASIVEQKDGETKTGEQVNFETRYNQNDSPEDNTFSKFTPSANFTQNITNPDLFGKYEVGKFYYFDGIACE